MSIGKQLQGEELPHSSYGKLKRGGTASKVLPELEGQNV